MRKALVKVGYSCNNRCLFCHSEPFRRLRGLGAAELRSRARLARARGAEMVVYSGGEPTLRPDLPALARFNRGLGLSTGLITNARRFVYPAFGRELRESGLRYAYVSFHAASPEAHERTARTDSFRQTLLAIANLAKLDLELTVNVVVTRLNIGTLDAVVDLLAALKPGKIKLSVLEPKGAALAAPAIVPPLAETAAAIAGAIRRGQERHPGQRFGSEGLTPCLLEGFPDLNDDLLTGGFLWHMEAFEKEFSPPDLRNRLKPLSCFDCAHEPLCPGVFAGYLSMKGKPPLTPEVRPRSNSFVLLSKGETFRLPASPRLCPSPAGGLRGVFLADGPRMEAFETRSADFTDDEVSRVVRLGQVYRSAAGRNAGLDYARDLVKLRPTPLCLACSRKGCPAPILVRAEGDCFGAIERELERFVSVMEGDLLDVGCGAVRFGALIEERVRGGRLRYLGLDPAAAPQGLPLERKPLEEFSAPPGSFDHVLMSRSYNHICRPSIAFPKLHRLLRPGGRLTIVDSCAFGLILPRPPPHARPGGFEHYRNHTSGEARAALEAFGFVLETERPVEPDGGCEWLLRMRRDG